jgi:DNA-damage-inducible protein D
VSELSAYEYKQFEDIKRVRPGGSEYWNVRELAPVLDYAEWRNFIKVIDKAMIACKNSGHNVDGDFVEVNKIIKAGVASKRVKDYELSRYACYLIMLADARLLPE